MVDMNDMSSIIQFKCKFKFLTDFLILYKFSFLILDSLLAVNQQEVVHEDLKLKFINGAKERKELYNKILELKGSMIFDLLK